MELKWPEKDVALNAVGIVLILAVLYAFFKLFDVDVVRMHIAEAGIWAPVLLVIIKATTIIVAPLGGGPLYPLAGAVFGFWKAVGLLLLGDALGAAVAFWISRIFGRTLTERMMGSQKGLLADALAMMGTEKGCFVSRLGFLGMQELHAYASGLTKIPFLTFMLIHMGVGLFPVLGFAALGTFLTDGNSALVFGIIAVSAGIFTAFAALFFQKRFGQQSGRL